MTGAMRSRTFDSGLLPIGEFDQRIGLTVALAQSHNDPSRSPAHGAHLLEDSPRRTHVVLTCYEDQNDHEALRADRVFKLVGSSAALSRFVSPPDETRSPKHSEAQFHELRCDRAAASSRTISRRACRR